MNPKKKTVEMVCSVNITRSVWAHVFGQQYADNQVAFQSSGTIADSYLALDTADRIQYIGAVCVALADEPRNVFDYSGGSAWKEEIDRKVDGYSLREINVERLQQDASYFATVQSDLRAVITDVLVPHEKAIRDACAQNIGVCLPSQEQVQTKYSSDVGLYLCMTDSHKDQVIDLFADDRSDHVYTISEYVGNPLIEEGFGIFACANAEVYADFIKEIDKRMQLAVDKILSS